MSPEVIKSFLVGLGFGIDEASLAKFNKAIASASLKVTALYASIKIMSAAIFYGISKISEGFEQMGYEYRIIAPAINKALMLRRELLKAYSAAGINIVKTVRESVKFNFSLAKTKFALEAIYKSVGVKFLPLLTKQMDIFRAKIYANMPKIQASLEKFVKFIFKAFEVTVILGKRVWSILGRVYDFFAKLHEATDGWSTAIIAAVAAWKLLNLAFLASPLGMILAGLTAILALYDDFKTWQEGGESFFDWSSFIPVIDALKASVKSLSDVFFGMVSVVTTVFSAMWKLLHLDFAGWANGMADAFRGVVNVLSKMIDSIGNAIHLGGAIGSWASGLLGNNAGNVAGNISGLQVGGGVLRAPLGVNPAAQSQTNQNVQQQTSINVMGSADAGAVGKAVANEQSRVNFDLTRNMRGAVR